MDTYVRFCPKCKVITNWKWPDQLCTVCGYLDKQYTTTAMLRCDKCNKFVKHIFLGPDSYCGKCYPMVVDFYLGWLEVMNPTPPAKLPFDLTLIRSPR